MKCLIVTPEKTVLDTPANSVIVPLIDGEYGVMPGHTPVVARIGAGELRVDAPDGGKLSYYVEGGFVEILDDVVALLTMSAQQSSTLKVADAQSHLDDALRHPANTPELAEFKQGQISDKRAKLRIAKKVAGSK